MRRRTALVVDDVLAWRTMLGQVARSAGLDVVEAPDGRSAVELARRHHPDVVLLDVGLPDMDGFEVCRQVRGFTDAYVVIVSGREDEVDKVVGLTVGADDYVTKPFGPRELGARLQAMLRRPRAAAVTVEKLEVGPLEIDLATREVHVDGQAVELTRMEFSLLEALAEHPGIVLSRDSLIERVWGPGWYGDPHVVDVHLSKVRTKLRRLQADSMLRTVRGVGFRLADVA